MQAFATTPFRFSLLIVSKVKQKLENGFPLFHSTSYPTNVSWINKKSNIELEIIDMKRLDRDLANDLAHYSLTIWKTYGQQWVNQGAGHKTFWYD
jgi:hypothetical protein